MDGYQFEYQCAEILKRNGFSRVQVTQSSGDQGVDIIAHKHRKKYGIQCKYYSYPVGNKAVQEAYAGANFYDCDKAVGYTDASHFVVMFRKITGMAPSEFRRIN